VLKSNENIPMGPAFTSASSHHVPSSLRTGQSTARPKTLCVLSCQFMTYVHVWLSRTRFFLTVGNDFWPSLFAELIYSAAGRKSLKTATKFLLKNIRCYGLRCLQRGLNFSCLDAICLPSTIINKRNTIHRTYFQILFSSLSHIRDEIKCEYLWDHHAHPKIPSLLWAQHIILVVLSCQFMCTSAPTRQNGRVRGMWPITVFERFYNVVSILYYYAVEGVHDFRTLRVFSRSNWICNGYNNSDTA